MFKKRLLVDILLGCFSTNLVYSWKKTASNRMEGLNLNANDAPSAYKEAVFEQKDPATPTRMPFLNITLSWLPGGHGEWAIAGTCAGVRAHLSGQDGTGQGSDAPRPQYGSGLGSALDLGGGPAHGSDAARGEAT